MKQQLLSTKPRSRTAADSLEHEFSTCLHGHVLDQHIVIWEAMGMYSQIPTWMKRVTQTCTAVAIYKVVMHVDYGDTFS